MLLANSYRNSLNLAKENGVKSIAFPSISTGVYGFPMERASKIALNEILNFLETNNSIELVEIVCFGQNAFNIYTNLLNN